GGRRRAGTCRSPAPRSPSGRVHLRAARRAVRSGEGVYGHRPRGRASRTRVTTAAPSSGWPRPSNACPAGRKAVSGARRREGEKARRLVATHQQPVKRQRRDCHHQTALWLVRRYDVRYLEDLRVATLGRRNRHLSTSSSDAAWGQFRTLLEATAADAGPQAVAVAPQYTSQDWSR